jgi:hypothetical protein
VVSAGLFPRHSDKKPDADLLDLAETLIGKKARNSIRQFGRYVDALKALIEKKKRRGADRGRGRTAQAGLERHRPDGGAEEIDRSRGEGGGGGEGADQRPPARKLSYLACQGDLAKPCRWERMLTSSMTKGRIARRPKADPLATYNEADFAKTAEPAGKLGRRGQGPTSWCKARRGSITIYGWSWTAR